MLFGSDLQGLPGKRADEAIIGFDDLVPEHNPQRAAVSKHDLIRERRPGFVRSDVDAVQLLRSLGRPPRNPPLHSRRVRCQRRHIGEEVLVDPRPIRGGEP